MQVPGNDNMGAKGVKPQRPDYWPARTNWPPTAGPIPAQPSGKTDRREALPPRIASGEGDQERLQGHGKLTFASGEVYEGDCSESRRVIEHTDGIYCGEVAEEPRDRTKGGGLWDGDAPMRHGQGRLVTTAGAVPNGDEASRMVVRVLEGEWVRDQIIENGSSDRDLQRRQPKGRLEYSDGSFYYGEFVVAGGNGLLVRHGYGKQVSLDGTLHIGRWENDRIVERDEDATVGGDWTSGVYGKGKTLIDDESIGRAVAAPQKPFWHAKPPPPIRHVKHEKGWNALLDGAEEDDSAAERHPWAGSEEIEETEEEEEEEEDDDDDFSALVKMLGGATSARTHEVLSIFAGFHATDAAAAARGIASAPSGDETVALLHELARGRRVER